MGHRRSSDSRSSGLLETLYASLEKASIEKRPKYLDVAIMALEAHGGPMTAAQITRWAMARGLLTPGTKTPERSMWTTLYRSYISDERTPLDRLGAKYRLRPGATE